MVSTNFERPSGDAVGAHDSTAVRFLDDIRTVPPERTTSSGERSQWTVAVNLAADATFNGDQSGASNQWRRLQELVEQSRGSSVNLVVQVSEGHSSTKGGGSPGENTNVTRYLVSNGEMRELSQGRSRGMAGDVEDLLRVANQVAPAEHVGLIQQSHGGSTDGVEGSAGKATLREFADAVAAGMRGSGHQKLDLIDFNACSMGSASVMQQMSRVADHMVASAEQEFSDRNGTFDAQNMRTELGRLMQNPQWTPAELASDMISQADAGANDGVNSVTGEMDTGTKTLAHYDLTHNAEFTSALDSLGGALATAIVGNRDNLAAVDRSIDSAPVLPRSAIILGNDHAEERDLSTFVRNLVGEIDAGRFTDADGSVRRSAEALLAAQRIVEPQHHGTADGGYDQLGGLNAFLPDLELRDPARDVNRSALGDMSSFTDPTNDYATRFENRERVARNMSESLTELTDLLGPAHADTLRSLREKVDALHNSADAASYRAALSTLGTRLTELSASQFGEDVSAATRRRVRDEHFNRESLAGVAGWQRFMEALRVSEEH